VWDADLVITSVSYSSQFVPFLDARWLQQGTFVTLIDQAAP
jgi:ornithine cyclodeaminase/alanine dehydrogenase-like protein (mu-crystallin family)